MVSFRLKVEIRFSGITTSYGMFIHTRNFVKYIIFVKIGYTNRGYPEKRNIIGIAPNVDYKKVYDLNKIKLLLGKLANKFTIHPLVNTLDLSFSYRDFDLNNIDLLHLFNAVSFSETPWISTFETIIPRFKCTIEGHHGQYIGYSDVIKDMKVLKALDAISSDSCKKLIAISKCNMNLQKYFLQYFPSYREEIEQKLIHLHPPQKLVIQDFGDKRLPVDGEIRFMFVGRQFFTKGGMEVIQAFQKAKERFNVKLVIVSSLKTDNYATKTNKKDVEAAKRIIKLNKDWIDYYEELPNSKVLNLMKKSHIGLLPTHADTYGYSVLEFQAVGCPVITTNIRALTEINSNERGWIINLPKNKAGEAIYTTKENREKNSCIIKERLLSIIEEIMTNRKLILRKANNAIRYLKQYHCPTRFSTEIINIYHEALK